MMIAEDTSRETVLLLTAVLSLRALRGRRDELRLPLSPDERRRLAELERVFGAARAVGHGDAGDPLGSPAPAAPDPPGDGPEGRLPFLVRLEERRPLRAVVEFRTASGELVEGLLRNLSTGGFFVETEHAEGPGERLTFRFVDSAAGRAWTFAGEVGWVRSPRHDDGGMGVRFVGVPVELRLGAPGKPPLSVAA